MKKLLLSTLLLLLPMLVSAYNIAILNSDGVTIYYFYISNNTELEVANGNTPYKGVVKIPSTVEVNGNPLKVTAIGYYAFSGCSELTSVTIPNTVTRISNNAFFGCSGLTSLSIPSSVTEIGNNVFYGCSGLKTLTVPNSITSLGTSAFSGCSGLTSVNIPSSITGIPDGLFFGCSGLTSAKIPNAVKSIGNQAFWGCSELKTVTIPSSVTSIGQSAFYDCKKLTSVTIPSAVTSIGDYAFFGCEGLSSVKIPNAVTTIGLDAFYDCTGLTSLTIGSSVTSIGDDAFWNCKKLTSVTSEMVTPCPINEGCFNWQVFQNATLYVPQGTARTYRNTNYWSKFKTIDGEEPQTITSVKAATESIPMQISSRDGFLTVKSELEGQSVSVYTVDGKALGSARVNGGQAIIATHLPKGAIVVVKVGERSVKASL